MSRPLIVRRAASRALAAGRAAFRRGEIGERELLAIGLASNDLLRELPNGHSAAAINDERIRERIAELDRQ